MAEVTVYDPAYGGHALTISSRLFSPYSFFVTMDVPHRKAVMKLITSGGGTVVLRPVNTTPIDYWLVPDFFDGNTRPDAKRVSIVLDSARVGQFPPLRAAGGEDYYSPFAKNIKKRTEYTDGEVRFLTAYMDMHVGKPPLGQADLNYLCELMNHKHTEESIRSKLKQLAKFPVTLEQTRNVTYQAPVVQNDAVTTNGSRIAEILARSVSAAKRTPADTVLATPVQVKPLAMSTQLPDTTTEVPDTPMPADKERQGNTQVPGTPETKKDSVPSSQKQSSQQSQSSSQSSNLIPDTPAKSRITGSTGASETATFGLHKNPTVTEIPATPSEGATNGGKASKHTKSPSKSPKQSTLPFKRIPGSPSSTAESFTSLPLVMRHSPKKNRDKGKEPLYPQATFSEVEDSSSPSSTRFRSSMVIADSQQSMSSNPLRFENTGRDSSEITESQIYSAPLAIPPGSLQFTVEDSGSGSSLGHVAAARQLSESGESSWSRDSSASLDSTTGSQKSRAGRRTRASRSLAKTAPLPSAVQTGSCLLYPRKFLTRFSHHPIRGVFYGIERVNTRQVEMTQNGSGHVATTQVETHEGVVATVTSSQSSSSFAEDSHIIVDDSDEEETEKGGRDGKREQEEGSSGDGGSENDSSEEEKESEDEEDDDDEEEVVQVPDSQEKHLLRDAQFPPDSTDDVSSVPDSQASVTKRPNAFTEYPVSSTRRYVDSSLELDVSVRSLPSIESIKARLKEFTQRVTGGPEDILGSSADKQFTRSSLGRQVALLELDSDGEVVEESFIEEEAEMVIKEIADEDTQSSKEYSSILYEDAQRRPSTSQLDEELGLVPQKSSVEKRVVEVEEEESEKSEDEQEPSSQISRHHPRAMTKLQTLLTDDVIDELLDSYQSEEEYPSEKFQVLPVPVRKDSGGVVFEPSFSVFDFPYHEISFDDIRDDLDYGAEGDVSQKEPMVGSLGIRPAVECVALILKDGVEGYLSSLQGHDPDVAAAFIVALCMSRQVSEHTTLDEIRGMALRFPRHVKFFAPKDDQVIASFATSGIRDKKLTTLKKRHFVDDISKRSDYLRIISGALAVELSAQANVAEEGAVVGNPGSSGNREDGNAQHVKMEMFDVYEMPRDYKSRSRSREAIVAAVGSSPEPSFEERKRAMEVKIRLHHEKQKAKKARRDQRASLRLEMQERETEAEVASAIEAVAKTEKKKRRRKEEKEEGTEEADRKKKKKRRKSKTSLEPVEMEVIDLDDPTDSVLEKPSSPDGSTPKPTQREKDNIEAGSSGSSKSTPGRDRTSLGEASEPMVQATPKTEPRKRGRPRKYPISADAKASTPASAVFTTPSSSGRKRGRPPKSQSVRKRGRPRKII